MGIYGGSLVEANEQSVRDRHRKLKEQIVTRIEGQGAGQSLNDVAEEVEGEMEKEEDEKSLFHEIWDIVVLEAPVIIMVIVIGQFIGYYEGWNILER